MIPTYKLIIGTANWFCDYNRTHVTEKQADEIIKYAESVGITEYDTAKSYADGKVEKYLSDKYVNVYTKGDGTQDYDESYELFGNRMLGYLIHHPTLNYSDYKYMKCIIDDHMSFGVSGYSEREIELFDKAVKIDICQIPMIEIKKKSKIKHIPTMIRKVFVKSKFYGFDNYPINECIKELFSLENWDRAVIGVDNVDQLKEIVDIWGTL